VGERDVVQGTLVMLILKTLALESMHGYGVATRIEQVSQGVFRVNPGWLLPALARMERAGHVKSEWRASENNRRAKYYLLTARGRKALSEKLRPGTARSLQLPGSWKPERAHLEV
jgi:PadR family transcriptional regulator PadR